MPINHDRPESEIPHTRRLHCAHPSAPLTRPVTQAKSLFISLRTLSVCFLLLAGSYAHGQPTAINVDQDNPPYMYLQHGEIAGIQPAILTAAFKLMGAPLRLAAKPWTRAMLEAEQGSAGLGGLYKNPERESKYDFSGPITQEMVMVYFNREHPLKFDNLNDLRGKTIGIIRNWSYGAAFDKASQDGLFHIEAVTADEQNFRKLEAARLDAVLCIRETGEFMMRTHSLVAAATAPLAENSTYLAFAKGSGKQQLLESFDLAIQQLRKRGEIEQIEREETARWIRENQ